MLSHASLQDLSTALPSGQVCHDQQRLEVIFADLARRKDDAQQRSWALYEDEGVIRCYLEELLHILVRGGGPRVSHPFPPPCATPVQCSGVSPAGTQTARVWPRGSHGVSLSRFLLPTDRRRPGGLQENVQEKRVRVCPGLGGLLPNGVCEAAGRGRGRGGTRAEGAVPGAERGVSCQEHRASLRLLLLRCFGAMCGLDALVISTLVSSVLPVELARDMQTDTQGEAGRGGGGASCGGGGVPTTRRGSHRLPCPPDHQKLCYSALILAMVFSMGEAVPYAHYGERDGSPRAWGRTARGDGDPGGCVGRAQRRGGLRSCAPPSQSTWARPSPSSC